MKLHDLGGTVFVLSDKQPDCLTSEQYEALRCLVERAKYSGGMDDCFLLCLEEHLLVLRVTGRNTDLTAAGLCFAKKQAVWVWLMLPELIASLFIPADTENLLEELHRVQPELADGLSEFSKKTARQLQPISIGFTHIDPAFYGDCDLTWYPLTPQRTSKYIVPKISVRSIKKDADAPYLVPPSLLRRRWAIEDGKSMHKLTAIENDHADWDTLANEIHTILPKKST